MEDWKKEELKRIVENWKRDKEVIVDLLKVIEGLIRGFNIKRIEYLLGAKHEKKN